LVGTSIQRNISNLPVDIAIVKDRALLDSSELRFEQTDYVAIGTATDVTETKR